MKHTRLALQIIQALSIVAGSLIFPYCQGVVEYNTESLKNKEIAIQVFVKSINQTLYYLDKATLDQFNRYEAKTDHDKKIFEKRYDEGLDAYNKIEYPYETACSLVTINFDDKKIQNNIQILLARIDKLVDKEWGVNGTREEYEKLLAGIVLFHKKLIKDLTDNLELNRRRYGFSSE